MLCFASRIITAATIRIDKLRPSMSDLKPLWNFRMEWGPRQPRELTRHQFGGSLWKRIRIGRGASYPCSGALQPQGKPDCSGKGSKHGPRRTSDIPAPCHGVSLLSLGITVLAEGLGTEAGQFVILHGKADFDWFAAYFAVLDVALAADG